jgi:hypothetical protein
MMTQPEARILGRFLVLQQTIEILPNLKEQTSFIRCTLREVPGLLDARFCFQDSRIAECPSHDDACALTTPHEAPESGSPPRYCAGDNPQCQAIALRTGTKLYGFMVLTIAEVVSL